MSDLGLGLTIGLRDAFSAEARRISESADSLEKHIGAAAAGIVEHERQMAAGIQGALGQIQTGGVLMGVGLAFAAIPTAAVLATNATQKALAEFRSLGEADLKGLELAAERFTNRWSGYNKTEFIGAAYQVKSALSELNQAAIETATGVAALTAKATLGGLAQTADTMTAAYTNMRSLNRELTDQQWFESFSGAMSKTVQQFKTTGPEISMALRNLGAVATSAGIGLSEQMAILGQLQASMPGEMAGTAYRGFLMKAAEGGRALGLEFLDAQGHLRGIQDIVGALRGRFPDLAEQSAQVQIKDAFGSDEAVKFILAMANGFDKLGPGIAAVEEGFRAGLSVTQEMARLVDNHLGASLSRIGTVFRNSVEAVGRSVLPWVRPVVDAFAAMAEAVTGFLSAHEGLSRVLLGGVAALGGLLFVGGAVMVLVGTLGLALVATKTAVAALATISITSFAATAAAMWPIYAGIAAVAGVVLALRAAWTSNFMGMADAVRAFMTGAWAPFRAAVVGLGETVRAALVPIGAAFQSIGRSIGGVVNQITGLATVGPLFGLLGRMAGVMAGHFARLGYMVFFRPVLTGLSLLATGAAALVEGLSRVVSAGLWVADTLLAVPRAALGIWRYFSGALSQALAPIAEVWRSDVLPAVQAVMGAFSELFGMEGSLNLEPLRMLLGAVLTPLRWLIEGVALLARGLGATLGGVMSFVVVPALKAVTTVLGWVRDAVQAVRDAVRDAFQMLDRIPLVGRLIEFASLAPSPAAVVPTEIISPEVRPRMTMPLMRPMMAAGLAAMSAVPQMPTPLPTGAMPQPTSVVRVESPGAPADFRPAFPPAPAVAQPFRPVFQPVVRAATTVPARRDTDITAVLSRIENALASGLRITDNRPLEVQVTSVLDGRRIGQAVARHNRDESVKEMG